MASTPAISSFSQRALARPPNHSPPRDPIKHAEHRGSRQRRVNVAVRVLNRHRRHRGDADHQRARRGGDAHRHAAPRVEDRHLQDAAADAERARDVPRDDRRDERNRQALDAVDHFAPALLVEEPPAEHARLGSRIEQVPLSSRVSISTAISAVTTAKPR